MITFWKLFGYLCGIILYSSNWTNAASPYFGTRIGPLSQLHHGLGGDVYAVDSRTIFIKNFNYDGEGPAAYFYVGNGRRPQYEGAIRLRDERGSTGIIRRYRNKDIVLSLPEGKTLKDFRWFFVWCDDFSVNFGDVSIPKHLEFPRPQKIAPLKGVHGVSSDHIVIVDAQTLLIPNFSYDGEAPDAKFWIGRGPKPSPHGLRIPDENGRETPLSRYDKKTIVLTLPSDLTVFDIGHFGVWCEAFTVDFGHVQIPENIHVPPSLKMLGISPQSKLNCEVLYDDLAFEVRWAVAGESVVVQLVAKLDDGEYMSFGISSDKRHSVMVGSDIAVAWVDKTTGKGYANDYYLDAKSQCSGNRGSCPDTRLLENSNSIRLLNAAMVNGYSIVTYQRPLKANDKYDLPILVNDSQAIVWAIGPLNQRFEVSFHSKYTKGDRFIDFGRPPTWNCPVPDGEMKLNKNNDADDYADDDKEEYYIGNKSNTNSKNTQNRAGQPYLPQSSNGNQNAQNRRGSQQNQYQNERNQQHLELPRRPVPTPKPAAKNGAWDIPPIQCYEPEDGVFYAQMGPTGGKQGYPAITGHVGWGISWYINGLLIPEINVVRGRTYTFVVEGGHDPDTPAKYHPFYITDDSVGGYEHKTDEEKAKIKIFAGVQRSRNGAVVPTGVGRLCNWTPDIDGPGADEYSSFGAYQRTLKLVCDEGEPGIITWRPDEKTPDTVYYHCFTHRYLGWKINVLDECDGNVAEPSERDEVYAEYEVNENVESSEGIQSDSSIRHETKVKPNDLFLLKHEKNLIKNHNMNEQPPKLINYELNKNADFSTIIADGIRAAEELEDTIARSNQTQYLQNIYTHQQKRHHYRNNINNRNRNNQNNNYHNSNNNNNNNDNDYSTNDNNNENNENNYQHYDKSKNHPSNIHLRDDENPLLLNVPEKIQSGYDHPNVALKSYLRPPSVPMVGPIFRPVNIPGRLPSAVLIERRPINMGARPYIIPQPSVLVNHYKKPAPSQINRHYGKRQKPQKHNPSLYTQQYGDSQNAHNKNEEHKQRYHYQQQQQQQLLLQYQQQQPHEQQSQYHHQHQQQSRPLLKSQYKPSYFDNYSIKNNKKADIIKSEHQQQVPVVLRRNPKPINSDQEYDNTNEHEILSTFKTPLEIVKEPTVQILKPALNTGFKPDSVIVESGFKPIIRRRIIQYTGDDRDGGGDNDNGDDDDNDDFTDEIESRYNRRYDENVSEIDESIEGDALFITKQVQKKDFEPMFIPSPPDSTQLKRLTSKTGEKLQQRDSEFLTGDLKDMDIEEGEDKIAMAAERSDAYYLPPDNISNTKPITNIMDGSGVASTVVTYDGKAVLDTSLLNPLSSTKSSGSLSLQKPHHQTNTNQFYSQNLSKSEQLVRNTPQFGPFRGEIPPPVPNFIEPNSIPQINVVNNNVHLNVKDKKSPSSPPQSAISTKLTLLNPIRNISPSTKSQPNDANQADEYDDK